MTKNNFFTTLFILLIMSLNLFANERFINKIKIIRKPVFNGNKKYNKLFQSLNKLHALTLKRTIKRDLLFKEGDLFEEKIIANTERKLRSRKYIREVSIVPETVSDTQVNILVITTDQWTTIIGVAMKKTDKGEDTLKLILKEYNLFGYGKTFTFKKDILNKDKKSNEFGYFDEHLFNSIYEFKFNYIESTNKVLSIFRIGKDFISDYDKYAYFLGSNTSKDNEHDDKIYDNYFELHISNKKIIKRFEPVIRIHSYLNNCKGKKIKQNYILGGLIYSSINYLKTKYIYKFGLIEDIKLGYEFFIGLKSINKIMGADKNGWGLESSIKYRKKIKKNFIFQTYKFNNIYLNNYKQYSNAFFVEHYYKHYDNLTFANILSFKRITSFKNINHFGLGSSTGLRGYADNKFYGNKYILFNSELRYVFKKDFINFFYPGVTLLYDIGKTYVHGKRLNFKSFYHNLGLNFKLIMYKTANLDEINFTVAFPFKGKRSPYFSVGTSIDI